MRTQYTIVSLVAVSVIGVSIFFSNMILAQPGRQGNTRRGGPPSEALNACQNKQVGASCRFESPHGTITGTCQSIRNQTACVPEGMGDGPPQGFSQDGRQQQGQMSEGRRQGPQKQRRTQTFAPYSEAIAVSSAVVDTGQDRCCDEQDGIACPSAGKAFYGQDAHYQSHTPAYRDNGDGTVTDVNTGLMWQQDPGDKMTYAQAVQKAATFHLAGYSDWRLPTIKELYSLILFSGIDVGPQTTEANGVPFIDTDYFNFEYGDTNAGERIIDSQFLSATTYVATTMTGLKPCLGSTSPMGVSKDMGYHAIAEVAEVDTRRKRFTCSMFEGIASMGQTISRIRATARSRMPARA